ncbi:glutamate receptor ionotropic, kainate 3-like [Saccostrea cucullata]|uniref:glutamate receptor ionotropic, kainate 3-like n=1 Tax=Saccostrea cuccullata TaxID=36930 RepID=UPI002ED22C83
MRANTAMLSLLFKLCLIQVSHQLCQQSTHGKALSFYIGILFRDTETRLTHTLRKDVAQMIMSAPESEVKDCIFNKYVDINVKDDLQIQTLGWTNIQEGIKTAVENEADEGKSLSVLIGPFYVNIAMIAEQMDVPYIVTDYKGFDWIDVNRVRNNVTWKTLLEMKPPANQVNMAVVDVMTAYGLKIAVVVKPDDATSDQECDDLLAQMMDNNISPISYSLEISNEDKMATQASELLRTAQMLNIKTVVVCSPREYRHNLTGIILNRARTFGMLSDETRIFILLDTDFYLSSLSESSIYRNKYYAARCQLLAFRYLDVVQDFPSPTKAIADDVSRLLIEALKNYMTIEGKQSDIDSKLFLESLKKVSFDGKTGRIQFDAISGARVNFTLHLYRHGGGEDIITRIGEWSPETNAEGVRFKKLNESEPHRKGTKNLFDGIQRVAVVLEAPFVMLKDDSTLEGNSRYEGFTIDLLEELSKRCGFEYEIYHVTEYGSPIGGGMWNGMVGEVIAGNATFGMGAISITSSREKDVDFSLGVMTTGVNLLISKPKVMDSIFQFMEPFSLKLWMAIVGASVGVSLLYFSLDYSSEERKFSARETWWFSIGTLLMRGTDFAPRPSSQRILTAGFLFFVLITVSSYTANMAAFLTTNNLEKQIQSLEELVDSPEFECGTVRSSATMNFFKTSDNKIYRAAWKKMSQGGLVASSQEGRERVKREKYAFIFDYMINSYSELTTCETKMVGTPFRLQEHGVVMKQGAPFKTNININLLKVKESPVMAQLKNKWWENKRKCDLMESQPTVEFGIKHMAGVFIVGAAGLVCAILFFLVKKWFVHVKNKEKSTGPDTGTKETIYSPDKNISKEDIANAVSV